MEMVSLGRSGMKFKEEREKEGGLAMLVRVDLTR